MKVNKMTVNEYREKYPNCDYCSRRVPAFSYCKATELKMSKRTARKCPCYKPQVYLPDITEKGE